MADCSTNPIIALTEAAATQINALMAQDNAQGHSLRLFIEEGGCSGYQYGMTFDKPEEKDLVIESQGVSLIVDPESLVHLRGIRIDYEGGLNGKGFIMDNPNAKRSCGCGKSFS